jgi:hypothetical protein
MRFAYADPPYEGRAVQNYGREARLNGRKAMEVNHPILIRHLVEEFPDGWALSCKTNSLQGLLPLCPGGIRVLAWTKKMSTAYPGIRPAYSWEPVLLWGGRASEKSLIVKDSLHSSPRLDIHPRSTGGVCGSKPAVFCRWIADCFGYEPGDEIVELFPGSSLMQSVLAQGVLDLA